MTDQKWGALAEAVKARRDSLRLRQKDLAALGGPSYETMRLIETNKLGSDQERTLQSRTIAGLERALRWKPGTVKAILDGTARNDHVTWDRLASAVRDRRTHLGWSQAAVSRAGGPSDQTVAKIETGRDGPFRANTLAQLDQGLGWIPGTAERIVNGNAGNDPEEWVMSHPATEKAENATDSVIGTSVKTVFHYRLGLSSNSVLMPIGARVFSVTRNSQHPYAVDIWAVVNLEHPLELRNFRIMTTCSEVPDNCGAFIGTVTLDNDLIWHVFEAA